MKRKVLIGLGAAALVAVLAYGWVLAVQDRLGHWLAGTLGIVTGLCITLPVVVWVNVKLERKRQRDWETWMRERYGKDVKL